MPDCLFCRIVAGELPATRIEEDERTLAFMDINPATRGHALVVPKAHARDLGEIGQEDLAACAATARRVAERQRERLGADGVNLLNAYGAAAWQSVFHFHIHVIPRYADDPLRLPWVPGRGTPTRSPRRGRSCPHDRSRSWRLEDDGPLKVLTIAKPPLNLFDEEVDRGLHAAIEALSADPPRGLLVRAEGKVWTGGVDVNLFATLTPETGAELWERNFAMIHRLEDLPCPVVFAAHGLCLTWGLELALACDLLVAAESAQFGLVEYRVGLTPSMGGPQRMAERAGPARARHFVMTGDLFGARTLAEWGVVTDVFADDEFEERSRALAKRLAEGPTVAHAATKAIVAAQKEGGARAADAMTPQVSGALFATEDLQNAVRSFLTDGPGKATYSGR